MLTITSLLFGVSSYSDIYQMTALTDERFSVHAEVAPPKAVVKVSHENKKRHSTELFLPKPLLRTTNYTP